MTTPKISRHNDAAYYPNIQCILCKEWVCSRNRYMHIESHLQYRPYKCSICGYDNRKEIFINLHIKKAHGDAAVVVYTPDAELEHSAWIMAEKCLQHTREVLSKKVEGAEPFVIVQDESSSIRPNADKWKKKLEHQFKSMVEMPMFQPYATQYRPKIYNSQRAEKSQIIEASRMQGLIPDLSEVCNRETKCVKCNVHVLAVGSIIEEHIRMHLSSASFMCPMHDCKLQHHSKSFLVRHMKEVHKNEFEMISIECFPDLSAKRRRRFVVPSFPNESIDHRQNNPKESTTTNLPHLTAALRAHDTTKPSELEYLLLQNEYLHLDSIELVSYYQDASPVSVLVAKGAFLSSRLVPRIVSPFIPVYGFMGVE
uniref:C2H2-type domain-containing protein n=1 Tax=Ditylenchus dipsaci TaxID=166011 RepID=A0A915DMB5_9BILA